MSTSKNPYVPTIILTLLLAVATSCGERLLVDSTGDTHANAAMKRLNEAKVQDFNTVASLMLINRQTGQVAEFGSRLKSVNVYSCTDDHCKTVALGGKLENLPDIEKLGEGDVPKIYYDACAFKDYVVGLYVGATTVQLDGLTYPLPKLHLFSWGGMPLAEASLPARAFDFDIDVAEKKPYMVDDESGELLRCDIAEVLDAM